MWIPRGEARGGGTRRSKTKEAGNSKSVSFQPVFLRQGMLTKRKRGRGWVLYVLNYVVGQGGKQLKIWGKNAIADIEIVKKVGKSMWQQVGSGGGAECDSWDSAGRGGRGKFRQGERAFGGGSLRKGAKENNCTVRRAQGNLPSLKRRRDQIGGSLA